MCIYAFSLLKSFFHVSLFKKPAFPFSCMSWLSFDFQSRKNLTGKFVCVEQGERHPSMRRYSIETKRWDPLNFDGKLNMDAIKKVPKTAVPKWSDEKLSPIPTEFKT